MGISVLLRYIYLVEHTLAAYRRLSEVVFFVLTTMFRRIAPEFRPGLLLLSICIALSASDIAAQHVFLEPCDRAQVMQPASCK